ncbi:ComF family protein [Actinobacteria bacterium YIM 96077]|uniref:ComF family protein n=2 Tax=Phytoactinopolyspora halophila TaxID=1981511 RepID=A0A329R2D3_9ACTN|nr:ComF family protein [Actinobacteria bacterium YIM 96077]RAW18701.1 ComF family protein [Phytoactinopolyspora halophila]
MRDRLVALAAAGSDLLFGTECAGCGSEGVTICADCRDELIGPATLRELAGDGDVPVTAAAAYSGVAGSVIIEHKERGRLALSRPLGEALSVAITASLEAHGCDHGPGHRPGGAPGPAGHEVVLVPVPSRRRTVRARGHDPVLRVARRAASILRRAGVDAAVIPALRHVSRVADQAGLGRVAREHNVHGSMTMRRSAHRLLLGRCIVLVDDVVTTGATLRECARVMCAHGAPACSASVIAVAA